MPISDCEVRDPRIRRTRQLLQGALQGLMQVKSFDEISVQDITDAATVNRATFYDHYTDKFALLEAMVAGGFHMLLHERHISYDGSCPTAIRAVILATCDYLTQTRSAHEVCTKQSAFEPLVDAAMARAIRGVLMMGIHEGGSLPGMSPEILGTAVSWTIYGAVKQWFVTPKRPPAEEIASSILGLVLPMLGFSGISMDAHAEHVSA
jgi:AcrR family transcriptional regulator